MEDQVNWIVVFEDQDYDDVYFTDEKTARRYFDIKRGSWSCHLFQRIASSV